MGASLRSVDLEELAPEVAPPISQHMLSAFMSGRAILPDGRRYVHRHLPRIARIYAIEKDVQGAVTGPIPGIVFSRRASSSSSAGRAISASSTPILSCNESSVSTNTTMTALPRATTAPDPALAQLAAQHG
jgi:hypothetical protein